jgi:RNA polymerase sigma factor (sigma-70 family)
MEARGFGSDVVGPGPRLDARRERRLVQRAQAGDQGARQELVQELLPFVYWVARGYSGPRAELEDLVQEGTLGLLKAIERFEPARGTRLTTYAKRWIEGEVQRAVRETDLIRLPAPKAVAVARLEATKDQLAAELGRDPSEAETAAAVGVDIDDLRVVASLTRAVVMDAPASADTEDEADLLAVERSKSYTVEEVSALLGHYAEWRGRLEGSGGTAPGGGRGQSPGPTGALGARLLDLEAALARLPDDLFTAVESVSLYGLGFEEAAQWLGVHPNTVRNRCRAALRAITDHLNGANLLGPARRPLEWMAELVPVESLKQVVRRYDELFALLARMGDNPWVQKLEVGWVRHERDGWVPMLSHNLEQTVRQMRGEARPLSETLGESGGRRERDLLANAFGSDEQRAALKGLVQRTALPPGTVYAVQEAARRAAGLLEPVVDALVQSLITLEDEPGIPRGWLETLAGEAELPDWALRDVLSRAEAAGLIEDAESAMIVPTASGWELIGRVLGTE